MSALESLNFDVENAIHYIHCILSGIPFNLPVSDVAPKVVPNVESDTVRQLENIGCSIVPHRLHIFKEPLDTKFGFVTFFIKQQGLSETDPQEVHELLLRWIRHELAAQLRSVNVAVTIGQPPSCHSCIPFLKALHKQCSFLYATMVRDNKKMETFLLSKLLFSDEEVQVNNTWSNVAVFYLSSLNSRELLWLSRELKKFPPVLRTDGNLSAAACGVQALHAFLEESLFPMIKVMP